VCAPAPDQGGHKYLLVGMGSALGLGQFNLINIGFNWAVSSNSEEINPA